jgi:NADPH:quinone reductase-like Zn-dependent oxidoreductase/acyl transferase domain-containing protein
MMTVGLSKISLLPYLEELDCRSASREIWVGCFNSPKNLTLTGNTTQLQDLQSRLERDSIFARALPVDVAYHSPFMTAISEDYEADIGTVEHGIMTDETPVVFSTLAGKKTDIEKLRQARYWSQNLISPVLFAQALEQMISSEFVKDNIFAGSRLRALVEIGPHAALRAPIGEILDSLSKRNQITYTTALTRKTSAIDSFLGLQGQLHCIGYAINWKAPRAYGKYPVSLTNLPEYPFNHDRSYWHESRLSRNYRMRKHARSDLLGVRVPDWNPLEARWRNIIRKLENPWVEDHQINGVAVYPGAGMLVMAIEAAAQLARDSDDRNPTGFHLKDVTFPNSLNISSQPEGVETEIHLRTLKDAADRQVTWCEFRLCLLKNGEWNDTCRGQILVEYEDPANEVDNGKELHERVKYYGGVHQSAMRECNKPSDPKKVYQSLERYGLSTGPTFRVLQDICYSGMQEARAKILSHQWTLKANPDHSQPHFVHPTALDGVMQLGIVALSNGGTDNVPTMVPSRIRKLWVSSSGLSGADFPYVIGSAKAAYRGYRETNIDVLVVDKDGALPRIVAEGLETIIIGDRAPTTSSVRQLSYKVRWMPDLDLLDNDTILAYSERQAQCSGAQEQQATGGANGAATELLPLMVVLTASMHKKPDLKILEVALSDGRYEDPGPTFISGGTDKLSQLLPESIQYDYIIMADGAINGEGAASVRDKASNQIRDSAQIMCSQVLKSDSYDIVIMQTKELAKDAVVAMQDNLQKLIRQDGKVICFTSSKDLSPNEVHMEEYLSLYDSGGTNLGFAGQIDTVESKARFSMANPMKWVKSSVLCVPPVVILIATKSTLQQELAANIKSCLTSRGVSNVKVLGLAEASSSASLKEAHHIFVTEVDLPFMAQLRPEEYMLLQNIVLNAVSILWISSTQQQQIEASSSIIVGLARTLRTERTDLKFVTVELETVSIHKVRTTQHIMKVFEQTISKPVEELEPEYVERDSMLYIGRVVRDDRMNQEISSRIAARKDEERAFGSHQALALGIANPGLLDSLRFEVDPDASRDLSPYEIEVEPAFSGLNFMDCLVALGRVPQNTLGVECAGTVVRSGERSDLVRGDRVMLCTNGTIRSRARCHCKSAIKIPDDLSFREAAALPGTAATVYHALHNIAHLQAGESILIHAGAGATGQMAIQMATQVGAIVYTTVGSKEKKAFVMGNYEIPESNIFYSRNASFAQKIKRITNGQGVDVVLNSLAGDSLVASWESIASFGRFIDIGKRDIYAHKTLPMYPFAKNTSFSVVDLAAIWSQRPEMMRRIFEAVLDMWVKGDLHVAQPLHVFPVSKVEDAFRLLQSGKSMGKLIIEMNEGDVVPTSLKVEPAYTFPADASYVIAGGLGGLGRSIARWMAGRGAKNLILLSRSGADSDTARALLEELTERGVRVVTPPCDITDGDALSQALTKCKNMPPIKGCIQATMVLKVCNPHLSFSFCPELTKEGQILFRYAIQRVALKHEPQNPWILESSQPSPQGDVILHTPLLHGRDYWWARTS